MTYTTTITSAMSTMSNLSGSSEGSEGIGRFKKRDLAKSAVKINTAFLHSIFASKEARKQGAPNSVRNALYSSVRAAIDGSFNILQGGQLTPSTTSMYKIMCKKHNKKQNTVSLGGGARGHWIGDPNAKHVMMFYHGGAFIMPGTFAHFEFMFHCRQRAKKRFHDFAVFCLDYSLVPHEVYPTQLRQAVSALRYLIEDQKRDSRTIMLGGDSAGGNLVAAVLLHLANPHPAVEPLKLKYPLRAALLISPWVSFSIDTPSFTTNAKKDLLTAPAIKKAGLAYVVGTPPGDIYAEPILATPGMWADIASHVVNRVLVTAGANELLCDEVVIFASKVKGGFDMADTIGKGGGVQREVLKSGMEIEIEIEICEERGLQKEPGKSRVEIEICEGEGHDEVILDYFLLSRGKGRSAKAVKTWMAKVL